MLAVQDFGVDVTAEDSAGMVCLTVLTCWLLMLLMNGSALRSNRFGAGNAISSVVIVLIECVCCVALWALIHLLTSVAQCSFYFSFWCSQTLRISTSMDLCTQIVAFSTSSQRPLPCPGPSSQNLSNLDLSEQAYGQSNMRFKRKTGPTRRQKSSGL
jgi:hypothetical protein